MVGLAEGLTDEPVRRIMVEVGEDFWGGAWPAMYGALGGNPWAAMPSLHFATSLAAAAAGRSAPGAGALGWGYARTLGFALVYLGEHYVIDLVAGAGLVAAVRGVSRWPSRWSLGGQAPASSGWSASRTGRSSACLRRARPSRRRRCPGRGRHGRNQPGRTSLFTPGASFRPRRSSSCSSSGSTSCSRSWSGLGNALSRLDDADPVWVGVAIAFCVAAFVSYVALFKAVVGGERST